VQVLSHGVLLDSSVNKASSPWLAMGPMFDEVKLGMKREVYKSKYSTKFNRKMGIQGNKVTCSRAECNLRGSWKESGRHVGSSYLYC